jgi:hypothetical protein
MELQAHSKTADSKQLRSKLIFNQQLEPAMKQDPNKGLSSNGLEPSRQLPANVKVAKLSLQVSDRFGEVETVQEAGKHPSLEILIADKEVRGN